MSTYGRFFLFFILKKERDEKEVLLLPLEKVLSSNHNGISELHNHVSCVVSFSFFTFTCLQFVGLIENLCRLTQLFSIRTENFTYIFIFHTKPLPQLGNFNI